MLREDILSKLQYDNKLKIFNSKIHLIGEAIDDPKKMSQLEEKLEIVAPGVPEIHSLVDMNKKNPIQKQK